MIIDQITKDTDIDKNEIYGQIPKTNQQLIILKEIILNENYEMKKTIHNLNKKINYYK